MDDAQKSPQTPSPVPTTPIVSGIGTAVGSTQKEQGPALVSVPEVLIKPTEIAPVISPEAAPFIKPSQSPPSDYQIIKASGENTPVPFEPSGIVQLPNIDQARQILKENKDVKDAGVWIATETVHQNDRTRIIRLKQELDELIKKAA